MEDYRQIILDARPGQIVPIVKRIDIKEPVDFFAKLSNHGRAKNCCLFESREHLAGFTELSFGTAKPALYLTGTGADFSIKALSNTGKRILSYLSANKDLPIGKANGRFAFCESVEFGPELISGRIKQIEEVIPVS